MLGFHDSQNNRRSMEESLETISKTKKVKMYAAIYNKNLPYPHRGYPYLLNHLDIHWDERTVPETCTPVVY